jgi:hypothetical protein
MGSPSGWGSSVGVFLGWRGDSLIGGSFLCWGSVSTKNLFFKVERIRKAAEYSIGRTKEPEVCLFIREILKFIFVFI